MSRRLGRSVKTDAPGEDAFYDEAACVGENPDLFFADGGYKAAMDICERCPVKFECREFAVARPWLAGIWGATTANERDRIRRHRKDGIQ